MEVLSKTYILMIEAYEEDKDQHEVLMEVALTDFGLNLKDLNLFLTCSYDLNKCTDEKLLELWNATVKWDLKNIADIKVKFVDCVLSDRNNFLKFETETTSYFLLIGKTCINLKACCCLYKASSVGHISCFKKYLLSEKPCKQKHNYPRYFYEKAIFIGNEKAYPRKIDFVNVEKFRQLCYLRTIQTNQLNCIQYFRNDNIESVYFSAMCGNIDCFRFLERDNIENSKFIFAYAAIGGNLELLHYLSGNKYEITELSFLLACFCGHYDCAKLMYDKIDREIFKSDCYEKIWDPNNRFYHYSIHNYRVDNRSFLKFLDDKYNFIPPFDFKLVGFDQMKIINFLTEENFIIEKEFIIHCFLSARTLGYGTGEIFKYLYENKKDEIPACGIDYLMLNDVESLMYAVSKNIIELGVGIFYYTHSNSVAHYLYENNIILDKNEQYNLIDTLCKRCDDDGFLFERFVSKLPTTEEIREPHEKNLKEIRKHTSYLKFLYKFGIINDSEFLECMKISKGLIYEEFEYNAPPIEDDPREKLPRYADILKKKDYLKQMNDLMANIKDYLEDMSDIILSRKEEYYQGIIEHYRQECLEHMDESMKTKYLNYFRLLKN